MTHEISHTGGDELTASARRGEVQSLPQRQSLVVFGARINGAQDLATELSELAAARGLPDDSVEWTRNFEHAPDLFFGRTIDAPQVDPTVPLGVIAFPLLRSYAGPHPMMRDFDESIIPTLCERFGVPLVQAEQYTPEQLSLAVGDIVAGQIAGGRPAIQS
jgi:hypothetical protein